MTQILMWKPELGKTTWSPQTPKQSTMSEIGYNQGSLRQRPRDLALSTDGREDFTLPLTLVLSHSFSEATASSTVTHFFSGMIALSTYI